MQSLVAPTWWAFTLQAVVLISYIPMTFIAYRLLREDFKRNRASWEISQFGFQKGTDEFETAMASVEYNLRQYIIPLTYIILIFAALYSMTSPYIIGLGAWKGLLEETANVFGQPPSGLIVPRDVLVGRFMFWCWLGAYIHSVDLTVRHYLAHDLTPNVYVNTAKRFTVAFVIGALVGLAVGSSYRAVQISFDDSLVGVYVVCFFIGMFPDTGIKWIKNFAERTLRQKGDESDQKPLSLIEGISLWQQGRLDQEDILNVQNLASADLLSLVASTPFDVGQIVDWVDQAILLIYACPNQISVLKNAGVRHASTLVKAFEENPKALAEATGLNANQLELLHLALKSATNMELISRYREHNTRQWENAPAVVEPSLAPAD
jgi:uncharacterized membrane protein